MADQLLKTSEIAHILGVSSSTIKRWVDWQQLPATRTVGKHRLIPLSGAYEFAINRNLPLDGFGPFLEELDNDTQQPKQPIVRPELSAVIESLLEGRANRFKDLILTARATGMDTVELADELIRPAMQEVGHRWEQNNLDIYQEHHASRIIESSLMDLIRRQPPPLPEAPLALGCSPAGDLYTIAGLFSELLLRELGWDVVNLGPNLPWTSIAKAIRVQRPKLAWISVAHVVDSDDFVDGYQSFYSAISRTQTAIIIGGSALSTDLRSRIVAASFGDRMSHMREFALQIHPSPNNA